MNNHEAKSLVDSVFEQLEDSKCSHEIKQIVTSNEQLKRNSMSAQKYPEIKFSLKNSDIDQLKGAGILDDNNCLVSDLSSRKLTPLEKILFTVIWKNGDLQKEKHIVEGVLSNDSIITARNGLVFFQFGKSLRYDDEPIIDQHVLRAFAIRKCPQNDDAALKKWRSMSAIGGNQVGLINDYRKWILSNSITPELRSNADYARQIDRLLFALGKSVKKKPRRKSKTKV